MTTDPDEIFTTYGGLFAGYGGLEMGVQSVLGGRTLWHSEIEAAPSKILAHHHPYIPNLGDITLIDWRSVPHVDVLTGGSPCQDLSHAGKRAGMSAGTRSGLWASMCDAIDIIRPGLVVWENVRGALSAEADSAMERCPGCVGGPDDGPVLRALGRVLGDLADLGYDASWHGLRASDVGAPHGRFRVFVFARDTTGDDERDERQPFGSSQGRAQSPLGGAGGPASNARRVLGGSGRDATPGQTAGGRASADDRGRSRAPAADASAPRLQGCGRPREAGRSDGGTGATTDGDRDSPADATSNGRDEGRAEPTGLIGRLDASERGDAPVADPGSERHGRGEDGGRLGRLDGRYAGEARQRERSREVGVGRSLSVSIANDEFSGLRGDRSEDERALRPDVGSDTDGCCETDWGQYGPAIHRWEHVIGRQAPAPTEPGAKDGRRLSPRFSEWLMGLPEGHVTDPAIGISRNDQLKALGNGVVPAQAAAATRAWLAYGERRLTA